MILLVLKLLQSALGLMFAYYLYKALAGKLKEGDWTVAFLLMMAVFVVAFIRNRLGA